MDKVDGRRERGAATRRAILDEARGLAVVHGADLTLDALAERVGLTRQAILHHFPGKERVLVELAVEAIEAECAAAVAAIGRRKGRSALTAFARGLLAHHTADLASFRLLYLRSQLLAEPLRWFPAAERRERLYPVTGRMYAAAEAALAGTVADSVDARALVVAVHQAVLGFALMYGTTAASGDPMKQPARAYLDVLLAPLCAGAFRPT